MTTDAKLDGRMRELDALAEKAESSGHWIAIHFRESWRTWLRDAAQRGLATQDDPAAPRSGA